MRGTSSPILDTRAISRPIGDGGMNRCAGCQKDIGFKGVPAGNRRAMTQIIANIYVDGRWNRVEHWHPVCYDEAGQPHGVPA